MSKKLKIIADENMPHLQTLFGEFAELQFKSGRSINANDVKEADALLCRSVTLVNQSLLQNSTIKFVGSATIGIDHLDTNWLQQNNIQWSNADGCNAAAVAQYVISAIAFWCRKNSKSVAQICVGIVGAGNVGTELARCLQILGISYRLCDPPLQRAGDQRNLQTMQSILSCDVISLHVPLTRKGVDKTYHLFDKAQLNKLTSQQLLINAARGEVIDNQALLKYLASSQAAAIILDVFENEPNILFPLIEKCLLATPHIAGHTLEGKSRGSYFIYQAFCHFFKRQPTIEQSQLYPQANRLNLAELPLEEKFESGLLATLLKIYDIERDCQQLVNIGQQQLAQNFDALRKNYPTSFARLPRRDYSGWKLQANHQHQLEACLTELFR